MSWEDFSRSSPEDILNRHLQIGYAVKTEANQGKKVIRRVGDDRDLLITQWKLENETEQIFKPIYRGIYDYLNENGWTHPLTDENLFEDLYWERWNPHDGMKEQWIWWRFKSDVNEYIRYLVLFEWQTLFVVPRDFTYKGKKPRGLKERINLILHAKFYLQFDINDKFKNSLAWKFKKAFFNRMYQQELEQHKEEVNTFALKLQRICKSYLALEKDEEWPVTQYGPLGYGDPGDDNLRVT